MAGREYKSEDVSNSENERIRFDPTYVVGTVWGKLRIAQIILSMVSGATASGINFVHKECSGAQFQFHGFISWITFVNVVIILILHLLNLYRRTPSIFQRVEMHLVLCGIVVISMLISASVSAVYSWCGWRDLQRGLAITSALFGYFCVVTFIAEWLLHFREFREGGSDSSSSSRTRTAANAPA